MRSLVEEGLIIAWEELGDLKTEITLVKKVNSGFDFGTSSVSDESSTNIVVQAVIFESKTRNGLETKEVFFRHEDVGKINQYSKILIDEESWDIGPNIINDDGFTKYLYVNRRGR